MTDGPLSQGSAAGVPEAVAWCAAELQFFDDGVSGMGVVGHVVEFEQVVAAAINAGAVSFFDDSALSSRRVAAPSRGVDGLPSTSSTSARTKRSGSSSAIELSVIGVPSSSVAPSPRT